MKCGVDPATFLSSRNQTEGPTYKFFNWNIMYKSSNTIRDCMLAFHHSMNPYLCPEYSLAEYNGELFNSELMVEVPFRGADGEIHYRWQYMVSGLHFLDSHFDSMTGPATTGKVFSVPSLNAMTLGGRPLRKDEVPYYLDWQNRNRNENQSDVFITTDTDILQQTRKGEILMAVNLSDMVSTAISKLNEKKRDPGDITTPNKGFDPNDYEFDGSSILNNLLAQHRQKVGDNAGPASAGANAVKPETEAAKKN